MDLLLKRGCSGTTYCHYFNVLQRACFSALAYQNLLPDEIARLYVHSRRAQFTTRFPPCKQSFLNATLVPLGNGFNFSRRFCYGVSMSRPITLNEHKTLLNQSPFDLVRNELDDLQERMLKGICVEDADLNRLASYYFEQGGKLFRPSVVLLMSRLCSHHIQGTITDSHRKVALVAEMIHAASLVHDDVIDRSDTRRNKPTLHKICGERKAILIGDYILAKATQVLASIGNPEVIILLAKVIEDLVRGEFMQLGSRDSEDARFKHYLDKTFKKTASLFAHSCEAVSLLSNCSGVVRTAAYEYGKNVGIAFQIVDDILDFVGTASQLGKPAVADLRLGLATAPVLFAARQHPELDKLIQRKFNQPGDVNRAWELVLKSDGTLQAKQIAEQYSNEAIRHLQSSFSPSKERSALENVARLVVQRTR